MTTDPAEPEPPHDPDARPHRPGVSVRTRITAAVAALVLAALAGAGLIIYALESSRLKAAAIAHADQEIAEFRRLQADGKDPSTSEPFHSARNLLFVFLQRNVPGEDEVLVAWLDDGPAYDSTGGAPSRVSSDRIFADTVRDLLATGGDRTVETSYGAVMITVQPVQETGGEPAALVVATFLDDARAELRSMMQTYAVVALLSLLVITAVGAWQAGRLLAPIRRLNDTARRISDTDLSARLPVQGNDDLSALTRTVNEMLARLEAAFTAQRQFLDDAGHELRTPLTVLRGHLEVLEQGDADDVAATRDLLLDEVDRMSRLVGDLILLAKSRQPDFLAPAPVALGPLTHTLLAKARALGDRDWRLDAAGEATLTMDEQRITQAVLQLADNAVKHTRPGDVVALGSSVRDSAVRLWVRDTGAGVPPEHREQIFERFGRGDVRTDDDGFGLGLSIVAAIAAAHDGTVTVRDATPPGALFELTLPREGPAWPTS